jgi:hypothetical protein
MIAIDAVATHGQTSALCQSIGIARASLYRRRQPARPAVSVSDPRPSPRGPFLTSFAEPFPPLD